MGRKLFREKGITAAGKVLAFKDFVPFTDRGEGEPRGLFIQPQYVEKLIKNAEKLEGKCYRQLLASDYMRFREDGNRSIFEEIYFERRIDLGVLVAAELAEKQGRFLKQITDLVWLICDEASWVLPAHNLVKAGDTGALPYCIDAQYAEAVDYLDLFAASTGGDLAVVLYFLGEDLGKLSASIPARLKFELERRIIKPVIDRRNHRKMFWLGKYGAVNNWCPWVISNVLTTAALTETDTQVREDIVQIALDGLDVFTSMYQDEGSCDEGPSYWTVAAGAYFNALEVLWDMTGGRISMYTEPMVRNMFEFISRVNVSRDYYFCFADSPVRLGLRNPWMLEMGKRSGSEQLVSFAKYQLSTGNYGLYDHAKIYLVMHQLGLDPAEFEGNPAYSAPLHDYMKDLKIAVSRENSDPSKGFYLAFKGGHNAEGHNHNDVGEVAVYLDGAPVFMDLGSGTYTRRTFSGQRYQIWALQSGYHNVAAVNGKDQPASGSARSSEECWNAETGELSMELKAAYPGTGLFSYRRSAVLADGQILVTDEPELSENGYIEYNYVCKDAPSQVEPGKIQVGRAVLEYAPELDARIETVKNVEPETVNIPRNWGAENIYRITLKSGEFKGKRKDTVRICRAD